MGINTTNKQDWTQQALSGCVLIADDSTSNLMLLRHQLEHLGLEVISVLDGTEVLEASKSTLFDLILMDLSMPHMNGMEAVKALRDNQVVTPVVALSGRGEAEGKDACLAIGFDDFWEKKGYTEEQLYELVAPFLKRVDDSCPAAITASVHRSEGLDQVFNMERLKQSYGNEEGARQIVSTFLGDASKIEETLVKSIDTGDYERVVELAHKLAGAAGMIQANQLGDLARRLESAAASGDKIMIARCFSRLQQGYERLCGLIQKA